MKRLLEPWAFVTTALGIVFTVLILLDIPGVTLAIQNGDASPYPVFVFTASLLLTGTVGIISGCILTGKKTEINYYVKLFRFLPAPHWTLTLAIPAVVGLLIPGTSPLITVSIFMPLWFYYCRHTARDNSEILHIFFVPFLARYRSNKMIQDVVRTALGNNCGIIMVKPLSIDLDVDGRTFVFECADYGIDKIKHLDRVSVCLSLLLREKYRYSVTSKYETESVDGYTATVDLDGRIDISPSSRSFFVGKMLYEEAYDSNRISKVL